jgi:anti-sigma factor RsiW
MKINIDISNYEEYLLSAIDGELSGEEMAELELFLQQHPQIREEMALLESVKLTPDAEVQFDDKNELYRESVRLLEYVDNELHEAEKQAFEELIRRDIHLSKELNLLQQARLQPDLNLHFGNKTSLYRHNRNTILPIWWWGAAAAIVAGVAVWVLPVLPGKEGGKVAMNKVATDSGRNNGSVANNQQPGSINKGQIQPEDQAQTVGNEQTFTAGEQTLPDDNKQTGTQQLSNNQTIVSGQQPASPGKQLLADNSTKSAVHGKPAVSVNDTGNKPTVTDNSNPGLSKLAQPVATSSEVVQQLQDKQKEQIAAIVANPVEKAPVLANATAISTNSNKVSEIVTAPAPVQGELVVSVTMNGDSKLLNGVANVARFFSRKKK